LSAAIVGIYSVTSYRDSYILHQSRLHVETAKKVFQHTMIDLDILKERLISSHLQNIEKKSPQYQKILDLQNNIIEKRKELYLLTHTNTPVSQQKIHDVQRSILTFREDRNNEIRKYDDISGPLHATFANDPRVARITIEKARLETSLNQLKNARKKAKLNVALSALCVAGFALALGAVCVTGIGALVLGIIASTVVIGATLTRVGYRQYEEKKYQQKAKNHTINENQFSRSVSPSITHKKMVEPSHSNILYIEKEIFHHDNKKVSQHLLSQMAELSQIENKPFEIKNNNPKSTEVDKKYIDDTSSDEDNRNPSNHI
jgi:hypothetical protein